MSLSVERFREIISYHPWHFWQFESQIYAPVTSTCNTIVFENGWQNAGASGRTEIRRAIDNAERRLNEYLAFPVHQQQFTETIDLNCRVENGSKNYSIYHQYFPFSLTLRNGRIASIENDTWGLVGEYPLLFSDEFNTGLEDTFSLTFADSTTTDFTTFKICFAVADRYGPDQSNLDKWLVEPDTITRLDANTIQVQGRKWLLCPPKKYQAYFGNPGLNNNQYGVNTTGAFDPTSPLNFVNTLGVYKKVAGSVNTATLIIDNAGVVTTSDIGVTVLDSDAGIIRVASSNGAQCPCQCFPWLGYNYNYNYPIPIQRLQITYTAGEDIEDWETVVTRLALAELQPRICACEQANYEIRRWQRDMSYRGSVEEQYYVDQSDLQNPLGNKLGHIFAWHQIKNRRMLRGINI